MDGPRGSLVIALLFAITGLLGLIAASLTQLVLVGFFGFVMLVLFVVAVIRVFVELVREGAASATPSRRPSERQTTPRSTAAGLDPEKRRHAQP